jgi:TatD DNase family protein
MEWIDTHAHLHTPPYREDLGDVLAASRANGVVAVVLPGTDLEDSRAAVDLAFSHAGQGLFAPSVFIHEAAGFRQTAGSAGGSGPRCPPVLIVAVGEIGLDYHYDFSPRDVQRAAFRAQFELALDLKLPVIIHEREATADCLSVLAEVSAHRLLPDFPGVFHCFSGSVETARILLDQGFYLGFDGPVTFRNARKALDVIAACPRARLLLETDSPI